MSASAPTAPPKCSQLEIHAAYSPAGFRVWSVMVRDLLYGLRHHGKFYSKPDAVRAAERLSRKLRVPFERGHQRRPEACLAERTKFAAWEQRQRRVAARAARQAQKHSEPSQ
jgi:hypothetical protein